MNLCRDCNSEYAAPGTCNCFAVGGKRYNAPYVPWQQVYPYSPPLYPSVYPYTPTWTITGDTAGAVYDGDTWTLASYYTLGVD